MFRSEILIVRFILCGLVFFSDWPFRFVFEPRSAIGPVFVALRVDEGCVDVAALSRGRLRQELLAESRYFPRNSARIAVDRERSLFRKELVASPSGTLQMFAYIGFDAVARQRRELELQCLNAVEPPDDRCWFRLGVAGEPRE